MILPVIIAPDRHLARPSYEVADIDDSTVTLLENLYDTMVAHDGIGISACQVGVMDQIFVIQLDDEDDVFELINPKILSSSGKSIDLEGCLSLPSVFGTVERAENIVVEYFNREGDLMEMEASGYLARCIQHELDHLNGVLFTEKIIERIPENEVDQWMEEHQDD